MAYWEFSDYVHTHQQDVSARVKHGAELGGMDALAREIGQKRGLKADDLQACLARQDQSKVEASLAEGKSLNVGATPTMFINGQEVEGILSVDNLRMVLDRAVSELANAKAGQ